MKYPILFTDLDGSLLNHDDYDWRPAEPMLNYCKKNDIPVIANTSKTHAEIKALKKLIPLSEYHIVENGGAVLSDRPLSETHDQIALDGYYMYPFVEGALYWQQLVSKVLQTEHYSASAFSQLSDEQLIAITHLTPDEVSLAKKRLFSEPIYMKNNCDSASLITALEAEGASILIGGRFMHVSGETDKGKALIWLQNYLSQQTKKDYFSIAIGDGNNDIAMLEAADIALIIPSPSHDLPLLQREEGVFIADTMGAQGWQNGIKTIFSNLGF